MSEDAIFILILFVMIAVVLGGPGLALVLTGQPRRYPFAACGACAADVSSSIATGTCPACRKSFAYTGVRARHRAARPLVLTTGLFLLAATLVCLVWIGVAVHY